MGKFSLSVPKAGNQRAAINTNRMGRIREFSKRSDSLIPIYETESEAGSQGSDGYSTRLKECLYEDLKFLSEIQPGASNGSHNNKVS